MNQLELRKRLFELQDIKYKEFHSGLCPNTDGIIGVRIPNLRNIAKNIAKENPKEFIDNLVDEYYEETMILGFVIGYSKFSLEETLEYLKLFLPKINNWAVCDCVCSTLKITKKFQKEMFAFLLTYTKSKKEFELRFAIVMFLNYYLTPEYLPQILEIIDSIKSKDYYVQMAIAWLISTSYIKEKEITLNYIKNNNLDTFTHNKAIQKIRESYRVSDKDKFELNELKR